MSIKVQPMKIKTKAMGQYQTNCYIVNIDNKDFIIDPGIGATKWVLENVENPVAIFNTHGHFDHTWSNNELQKELNIPLYTPKQDVAMLQEKTFMPDLPPSIPDIEVNSDEEFDFDGVSVKFRHFPGHSPGCSTIEIGDVMFSGDFIFKRSIGRSDFPASSNEDMKKSLEKFSKIDYDKPIYPGHGESSTIKEEQKHLDFWLNRL